MICVCVGRGSYFLPWMFMCVRVAVCCHGCCSLLSLHSQCLHVHCRERERGGRHLGIDTGKHIAFVCII